MRFDDRLSTILNTDIRDGHAKAAAWGQLVDILAQDRGGIAASDRAKALSLLDAWRDSVEDRRRLSAAASIAGRPLAADLVGYFARDSVEVATPVLARAALSGDDWQSVIGECRPAARALLRDRSDLPQEARAALEAYGKTDLALPDASSTQADEQFDLDGFELAVPEEVIEASEDAQGTLQIDELVRRIEAYRDRSPEKSLTTPPAPDLLHSFAFECDADGMIDWVEGAPRGGLIGLSLAHMADAGGFGVDGHVSGAFRKRDAIREGRLSLPGSGVIAGDWTISAQPFFDAGSGRFGGYRGIARRNIEASGLARQSAAGIASGSVRQLVHELRTPLNAIRGFAEMIEGQFVGEVPAPYRRRAENIILESGRLLRIFEDLDLSARLASGDTFSSPSESDLVRVMRTTATHHGPLAASRGVKLKVALPSQGASALVDEASAARLIDRLLLCALSSASSGEQIKASLTLQDASARISVSRPKSLVGVDEKLLLDPTLEADRGFSSDEIPLGLAFLLRLTRQLARHVNGRFEIGPDSFALILPRAGVSAGEIIESI